LAVLRGRDHGKMLFERDVLHRYAVLLGQILATLGFQLASPDTDWARLIAVILQALTLVVAVITSDAHHWVVRATIVVAIVAVAGSAAAVLGTQQAGTDSSRLVSLLMVALAPAVIVDGLRKHYRAGGFVTRETMFGVLCIYLLIGAFFSTAFGAIQALGEHDFFASGSGDTADFLYFSFSTLTTTGYGDLVAGSNLGRSLAITEALIGQIYLVTVVAVIVANLGRTARRA
jgi:hypothetical protein